MCTVDFKTTVKISIFYFLLFIKVALVIGKLIFLSTILKYVYLCIFQLYIYIYIYKKLQNKRYLYFNQNK